MKKIATIIFVVVAFVSNAQLTPGYQGKKNIFSFQLNVSPTFLHPNYQKRKFSSYDGKTTFKPLLIVPFNVTPSVYYERVLGRKFSLSANYSFVRTRAFTDVKLSVIDPATNTSEILFQEVPLKLNAHYVNASMIIYGRRALAPFGKYFKLHLGYVNMRSKFEVDSLTTERVNNNGLTITTYKINTGDLIQQLQSLNYGLSFGMNRIYKSKVVINRGITLSNIRNPFGAFEEGSQRSAYTIFNRIRRHDVLSFYISVGYLL